MDISKTGQPGDGSPVLFTRVMSQFPFQMLYLVY